MRIVVDLNHPAHVHLFKNFIEIMNSKGHDVLITASDKEITFELLNLYNFEYVNLGSYGKSPFEKLLNVPKLDYRMYKAVKKFNPDIFLGVGSIRASHVAYLMGKPSIAFEDTEHCKEQHILYIPFTSTILTPSCFKGNLGKKQIRYNGYHEISYLHPNYFKPNPSVLEEMGLSKDDNFFLIRFASFSATHDTQSEKFKKEYVLPLIEKLEKNGKIIISSEEKLDKYLEKYQYNLSPTKYHDVLYHAKMYIGESSTSAEEAAILGTPSLNFERILINGTPHSFGELSGVLNELENKYGLVYCFHDEEKLLQKLDELLDKGIKDTKQEWIEKSYKLLKDNIDVTQFMVWFIENYPKSFRAMKSNYKIQYQFKTENLNTLQEKMGSI